MLSGHWSSASGDIKYLTYHVTLQNHVIKESSNYDLEILMVYHQLPKFGGHRYCRCVGQVSFLGIRAL